MLVTWGPRGRSRVRGPNACKRLGPHAFAGPERGGGRRLQPAATPVSPQPVASSTAAAHPPPMSMRHCPSCGCLVGSHDGANAPKCTACDRCEGLPSWVDWLDEAKRCDKCGGIFAPF